MFVKLRENIWLGNEDCLKDQKRFKDDGINRVVVVADDILGEIDKANGFSIFWLPLRADRMNPTHLKDLACHCPKYMVQNGDKVLIISRTGLGRGAYIAARMICELEGKSIYDIFLEMQPLIPGFDIGKAYF